MNLPLSSDSYTLVYQRCCRNGSITNIQTPGDVGATYFIEITPLAQSTCNNSPIFDEFREIAICNDEFLEFDHSAKDDDSRTQLVYEFCTPFVGGGKRGASQADPPGSIFRPDGVAPDPDMPPPYNPVAFRPLYNFLQPMGGAPIISINPNTGIISGKPNVLGQFVVGVCVKEYLDGELLSEVRRDFQFNVLTCDRRVNAAINANAIIEGDIYYLQSCGSNIVTMDNLSTDINFIDEYEWSFDINGTEEKYFTREPTVVFPDTGIYEGTLILNKSNPVSKCKDTADIRIGVFGGIEANFDVEYDTCAPGPAVFTNQSHSENGQIAEVEWIFDDGSFDDQFHTIHTYDTSGSFQPVLRVKDIRNCEAELSVPLFYYPVPPVLVAAPDQFKGCLPATIRFVNLTPYLSDEYDIRWQFGDGHSGQGVAVSHTYLEEGQYTIDIKVTSPIGCTNERTFTNWIETLGGPSADFDYNPKELNQLNKTVNFQNLSNLAVGYRWEFGDGHTDFSEHAVHDYVDTGSYIVNLFAFHQNGCSDTASRIIDIFPLNTYFLPNAFTPNDDNMNDEYLGKGLLGGIQYFRMEIWNRWGELVFETEDPRKGWNGRRLNTGQLSPKGVYHCKVIYRTSRGELRSLEESVSLIR